MNTGMRGSTCLLTLVVLLSLDLRAEGMVPLRLLFTRPIPGGALSTTSWSTARGRRGLTGVDSAGSDGAGKPGEPEDKPLIGEYKLRCAELGVQVACACGAKRL